MPSVTLKSRLPEIAAAIPTEVGAAIHHGTEQMAQDAANRAPELTGELKSSIEAGSGNVKSGGEAYGIWADWYWFFSEFGTRYEAARPWMIPAVEAGKEPMLAEVRAALEKL